MSGESVDTNVFNDDEVTSLSIIVVDNLIFQTRAGLQRNVLDALNDAVTSNTVATFDLENYTISAGDLPSLDSSEDLSLDTIVINGSTDSAIDHKVAVAGLSIYSEDGSGFFNGYVANVSGFVDSSGESGSLRGVVSASKEIYLGNGAGGYIKLGLAMNGLFGLLPAVQYSDTGNAVRQSLHRFGFGLENFAIDIPIRLDVEDYLTDFIIENNESSGNAFAFNFNEFQINIGSDASGKFLRSLGAFSVQFVSDTDAPFKLTPVSPRAREYADSWLETDAHTFHSLLKGLFGQMLVNSGVVPVELTLDKLGSTGEPFIGYITDDSLERNVVPKFTDWVNTDASGGSFFEQEHSQIMANLGTSFKNIWSVDANAEWYANLYNVKSSGPVFNVGDTFSVPIEVLMRYEIRTDDDEPNYNEGMNGSENFEPVAVSISNIVTRSTVETEEKWRFVYKFDVIDASGNSDPPDEGTVSSGPKVGYTVFFYSLKNGSLLHTNSTKTNSDGMFFIDAEFTPDDIIYKVVAANSDGNGYDGITLEVNADEELSAIFDADYEGGTPMCTALTTMLAEVVPIGSTKDFFYAKKASLESKLSSLLGFNLNLHPYLYQVDETLATEISKKVLEIEAIQSSMANILAVDAGGLSAKALRKKIMQGMAQVFEESAGVVDLTNTATIETTIEKSAKSVLGSGTDTTAYKSNNKAGLAAITTSLATVANQAGDLGDKLLNLHKKAKQIKAEVESVGVAAINTVGIDAASFGDVVAVAFYVPPEIYFVPAGKVYMVYQFTNTDTTAFLNYTRGSTTTAELPYYSAADEIPDWTLKNLTTGVVVDGSGKILTGLENGSRYEVAMFVDADGDAGFSWFHNGSGNSTSHIRKNTTNVVTEFGTMPLGRNGSQFREYGGTFSSACGVPVIKPGTSGVALFYKAFKTSLGESTDDPNSYGVIPGLGDWDMSNVTTFEGIFREARLGTVDLSSWTFPLVQTFTSAFILCDSRFNPIGVSTWDMSEVTTLNACFQASPKDGGRSVLDNIDVTGWDVSKVQNMDNVFRNQYDFNQDIGGWNTMSAIRMDGMFRQDASWDLENVPKFNQNLSSWDVSKVTRFVLMFSGCTAYNQDIIGWNVTQSQVTYAPFAYMFKDCTAFNGNLSNWTFGSKVEFNEMFSNCPSFQGNGLETWDFSATTIRLQNFSIDNVAFNPDLSSWDVSSLTYMRQAFSGCTAFNSDISSWNTSNLTNMTLAFKGCASFNQNLELWDVSNVTDMYSTFDGCASFNQDISSWNTQNVTVMNTMFSGASSFNQDISSWVTSSVTTMDEMFKDAVSFNYDMTAFVANSNSATTTNMFSGATAYSF